MLSQQGRSDMVSGVTYALPAGVSGGAPIMPVEVSLRLANCGLANSSLRSGGERVEMLQCRLYTVV
jgi:hypothetical protein